MRMNQSKNCERDLLKNNRSGNEKWKLNGNLNEKGSYHVLSQHSKVGGSQKSSHFV